MKRVRVLLGSFVATAALLVVGCGQSGDRKTKRDAKADSKSSATAGETHAHGAGPHGGAVGDWGHGKFHFEFTVDHDKKEATVYILGKDEQTATPIKAKDDQLSLSIKGLKDNDEYKVVLKAAPQKGDPEGKASRFVGQHEKLGVVQEFAGTVSGEADGAPYTGDFKEEPAEKK